VSESATWAVRGLRPWTMLIWLPLCYTILITPVADPAPGPHSWAGWVLAVAAGAAFTGAILSRYMRDPRREPLALSLLAALAVLAVATTAFYSPAWSSLFVLLAIEVGVVVGARVAPVLVLVITAVAVVESVLAGATGDAAFTTGLSVLLSGLGTYAFHQLFAVVVELRCTREELARMAVSQERERFARDLHDLLGHTLSVIVVKAEAVRRLAPRDSAAAAEHAADIETIGREALTDIRRAASGYRGAGLDRELARAHSALGAAGVALSVQQDREPGELLPESTDVLLGWVVREGVTNIVRHAGATRCTITVDRTARAVRLHIDDDGHGDLQVDDAGNGGATSTGSGLRGLGERVAAAGGQVEASRTDRGFRLVVDLPCAEEATAR
jgi:two-component system sensor histidine kinase DesK